MEFRQHERRNKPGGERASLVSGLLLALLHRIATDRAPPVIRLTLLHSIVSLLRVPAVESSQRESLKARGPSERESWICSPLMFLS
jgi:hypothetical protein